MPILNDIMDHDLLGPLIRQGRDEGRAEGRAEGRSEGQMELLLALIERRFGRVPARYRKQLAALTPEELKTAGLRLMDVQRLEDLFPRT
jgi:predicted transposase YdaD